MKNKSIPNMARTMLIEGKVTDNFWKEVVHIAIYIHNRCLLRPHEDKMTYELWFGRKATIIYFKNFGSKCYIKNTNDSLGKFDDKANEGIFLGYSSKRKAYQCFNKRMNKIVDVLMSR